jgi:hypothetical protein
MNCYRTTSRLQRQLLCLLLLLLLAPYLRITQLGLNFYSLERPDKEQTSHAPNFVLASNSFKN